MSELAIGILGVVAGACMVFAAITLAKRRERADREKIRRSVGDLLREKRK